MTYRTAFTFAILFILLIFCAVGRELGFLPFFVMGVR